MFVLNFQFSLSLLILIQRCLSIPFDYSDFSVPDLNSDYTSFPQDESSNPNSNLLALSSNDADASTISDPNLIDYSLYDNEDWLSSSTQADNNLLGTFGDMTIANSGAMCPLGKREDGVSCTNDQQPIKQPIKQPLPPLDLEGLSAIFGITNNNGESGTQNGDLGTDANAGTGSLSELDPCSLRSPYLVHACCDGPAGRVRGGIYNIIQSCAFGTCTHLAPVYLLFGACQKVAKRSFISADPITHICPPGISACCNTLSRITSMVSSSAPPPAPL